MKKRTLDNASGTHLEYEVDNILNQGCEIIAIVRVSDWHVRRTPSDYRADWMILYKEVITSDTSQPRETRNGFYDN
jgi:hypothetical protein